MYLYEKLETKIVKRIDKGYIVNKLILLSNLLMFKINVMQIG